MRLLPPPLTALLLMLASKPTLLWPLLRWGCITAAMGRCLRMAWSGWMAATSRPWLPGAPRRSAWLFGCSCQRAGAICLRRHRSDVILRDTAVVGLVGGAGLGWRLMEPLSSFHWPQVGWLILVYAAVLGELA